MPWRLVITISWPLYLGPCSLLEVVSRVDKTTYMLVCTIYILVGLAFTSTIIELVRYIITFTIIELLRYIQASKRHRAGQVGPFHNLYHRTRQDYLHPHRDRAGQLHLHDHHHKAGQVQLHLYHQRAEKVDLRFDQHRVRQELLYLCYHGAGLVHLLYPCNGGSGQVHLHHHR
jgi:hypothetical protein